MVNNSIRRGKRTYFFNFASKICDFQGIHISYIDKCKNERTIKVLRIIKR